MKNKISVLTIAIILTVILFSISTYLQKRIINYEPTIKCYVACQNIGDGEKMSLEKMKQVEIPIPLVMDMKIIQEQNDIENMYSNGTIYAGQILVKDQFDTKENLSIFEAEEGKEKISIKIKSAENGVSYRIKEKSVVNIYATMRTEYANNVFENAERRYIGSDGDGYCSMKVLSGVKVIGVFDSNGTQIQGTIEEYTPDTIMICVSSQDATDINLIRDVATFNITEM